MRKIISRFLATVLAAAVVSMTVTAQTTTNKEILERAALQHAQKEKTDYKQLISLARQKGWELIINGKNGNIAILSGVDLGGYPLYTTTVNNIIAAATIGTSKLWPGGSAGLTLSGSSNNVKDKLAIWDGGKVRSTHVELTGRVIQRDASPTVSDHSTHVAGTMIASGVNPLAKGMSYGEQELVAYDFNNDNSEMLTEAPNLLVSNHSYGEIAGWYYNDAQTRWEFRGRFNENEDYKMGYYSEKTQLWDSIAYNAPYYLIVKASGNNRNENGPAVGQPYWRYDALGVMSDAGNRPAGISNNNGYDIIPSYGVAKNILTIGAVNPIASGYSKPSDVTISSFSSWGPTDDGRIKPDVVADGVNLLSSIGTSDNAYDIYSGTSMSTPNASGSLLLLQEYYSQLHAPNFMRAATLKGLIIHTADEAGTSPGPDYQYGWGLINMQKAAAVITANNTRDLIEENVLNNGDIFTRNVVASGRGPLIVTISWTDPKGTVEPSNTVAALNNTTKRLVDDLDMVVKKGAATYFPWKLDPGNPSFPATTGDNNTDNVEKIVINDAVPGDSYTIQITHKGVLQRSSQAYSLIVSGVGGVAYCNSNPTVNTGARIDSVSFSTVHKQNPAGCTTYTNYTNLTADIEPNQTLPLFIRLNSCDASATDKIVKVFIDYNNDGDFADAGENIAASAVINGDGNFTANITTPASLPQDYYSILRIVAVETNAAASVTPCGTYAKGETQDYRIRFAPATNDVGVIGLISPQSGNCGSASQFVTIRIRNFGGVDKSNVPVTAIVKQGATTIATLTATYTGTITASGEVQYTFQTPFNAVAGATYTIAASTSLTGDQATGNDQLEMNVTIAAATLAPTGTAEICGVSGVQLQATNTSVNTVYTWYDAAAALTPIASGISASSSIIPTNNTYYLAKNDVSARLGPVNKAVLVTGGYNTFSGNFVRFTSSTPLVIETARLYTRSPGKITFIVANLASFNSNTGAYSYQPISTTTIDVTSTSPNPATGAQNDDVNDQGAIFYLGLQVPTAGDHILIVQCQNGASIFRNNGITVNPYPFTMPGIMSITGNSAVNTTTPTDVNFYQGFYYFFYNMAVSIGGCASPRTAIVATNAPVPVISLTGNNFSSSLGTGNQWYLNGAPISGATAQNYTATASGLYKVVNTNLVGCSLSSNEINFAVTAIPNVDPSEIGLIISPNPARSSFVLQLETRTKDDLQISLVNTAGQQVYQQVIPGFIGRLSTSINPGYLAPGVYYINIQHNKKAYNRKLVIIP